MNIRLRTGLLNVVFCSALILPVETDAATYTTYTTGNFGELLTELPGDSAYRVLYSLNIDTVSPGDILVVNGETEMSNEADGTTVRWTSAIILANSATSTTGLELSQPNNFGCEHIMHHCVTVKPVVKAFPSGSSSTYVNFITKATGDLTVEQDYGRLQVLKIHP